MSGDARITLVICAPGDEIYSYWGHAAIRVNDPASDRDIVFNYGVFSFDEPHFIWRFAMGETDYQLAVYRFSTFMREYQEDHRKVTEYELLLTPAEKSALFNALVENYKPENRFYRYSQFEDNCSTRVRDQIERAVGGRLQYNTTQDEQLTFRALNDRYVMDNSWSGLGIKLALGLPTDAKADFRHKMFLPDYLGQDMVQSVVERETGRQQLCGPATVLNDAAPADHPFSLSSPAVIILLLLLITLLVTLSGIRKGKEPVWFDTLVFAAFGIAGMILCFTTFISVMPATKWNFNLAWAWPTHLLVAFAWPFRAVRAKLTWYLKVTTWLVLLFLVAAFFLPQTFHWLMWPICLILLLRTGTLSWFHRKKRVTGHP